MLLDEETPKAGKTQAGPFSIDRTHADPWRRKLFDVLGGPLEHALGLEQLNEVYREVGSQTGDFIERSLAQLKVQYAVADADLARIPKTGPFLVVSNHPFGGLDGMILAAIIRRVRPDAKVMANFLLSRVPELRPFMIFVDPFGGKDAVRNNLRALKESMSHVQDGHPLIVFPAGAVSHLDWHARAIVDPAWSDTVARIVRRTRVPVLPAYFHGNNSKLFNLLGMLHPRVRTAMLPRELLNKRRRRVEVQIGTLVPFQKLEKFASDQEMTAYLRLRSYILQTRRADTVADKTTQRPTAVQEEIVPPVKEALLTAEANSLPREALLTENDEFEVFVASAQEIPHTLREIGRLREVTFRQVHEGTGKSLDLDEFDQTYLHLFCRHKAKNDIVGAYRLGCTDVLLARQGVKGLYTRTLFRYPAKLLAQMGPALEMGRSFVRPEYQRSFAPLLLLWRGIAQYVVRHPQYQVLFGPVSINNQYASYSQQLIMTFLRHTSASHLAGLIRAKNPPRIAPLRGSHMREYSTMVRDIDEVSDLVQEIEADHKGIPVLLRQYMKLSARLLGFNVDPDFGDVLDGLMVVDLRRTPVKLIERFAGKEGAAVIVAAGKANPAGKAAAA